MRKFALSFLLCAASAFATEVQYSTSGLFTSTGANTTTEGGATITFKGNSADVSAPTFSSLGTFEVTDGTNTLGSFSDTFTLTITQTLPDSGTGTSSTTVSGQITGNSSGIELVFSPNTVVMADGISYIFSPDNYGLNNPSDVNGDTTIEAFIPAPEPASMGLLGGALLGVGILSRRLAAKK